MPSDKNARFFFPDGEKSVQTARNREPTTFPVASGSRPSGFRLAPRGLTRLLNGVDLPVPIPTKGIIRRLRKRQPPPSAL